MWKIAIVDDDRHVLKGLKSIIPWEELNAEWVGEAMDGSQGLDIVHESQPDILITDIYMPEMNGMEMIQTLRHEGYEGKIIIHSGYNDFEYARQALRLNVEDYLSKPISLQTLQTVLAKAIEELAKACAPSPSMQLVTGYRQLSEAMKTSQEKQAIQLIEVFMYTFEGQAAWTPSSLRRFGMECWAMLTYAMHEVGICLDDMFPQEQVHAELNSMIQPDQFRRWISDKISHICKNRGFHENARHKEAVDFILDYVQEHYAEEITMTELSEKVFISRNYLCDIFKKVTGETFLSYLTRVRMERAKQLVMEGKHHIYEIAQQVGYKNVPYFSTAFKKFFNGVSPTELIK